MNNNYEYIGGNDSFQKFNTNIISNVDLDIITKLYQPLIGYKSTILYLTLINFVDREKIKHETIFNIMQISPGDFLISRKSLEACGLIKTYIKKKKDFNEYIYIIYSPKNPKDFFDDIIFRSLLIKYLGEKETKKIASFFKLNFDFKEIEKLNNISANFSDVFGMNLNIEKYNIELPFYLKDNQAIEIDADFSFDELFKNLEKNMISRNCLTKQECIEIKRIATLYGLNASNISDIISQIYNENSKNHIDWAIFKKKAIDYSRYSRFFVVNKKEKEKKIIKISGKTILADKIRMMEIVSPRIFLQTKQNGVPLAIADLKLIDYLSGVMQLNNSVINAIIDYCLRTNNNRFTRNYVEKIAGSIKRENINNALDTLNYLELPVRKKEKKINNCISKKKEEKYDEQEYNELLKLIGEDKVN